MKQKVIVCDIDGVILRSDFIFEEIFNLKLKGDDKWAYFDANCNSDRVELMSGIKPFLRSFGDSVVTIISTARSKNVRFQTAKKLWQYKIGFEEMYMREGNDYREAKEVKKHKQRKKHLRQ